MTARLSLSDAAERLGISTLELLALVGDGEIRVEWDGRRMLFDSLELDRYMRRGWLELRSATR